MDDKFMNKLKKLLKINIISTLYFNFHYLPLRQALKIPIFLFRPTLLKCKGEIVIDSNNIYTGMIQLGEFLVPLYPNSGFVWQNKGGRVIFKGRCFIGSSSIAVGNKSLCVFGDRFIASAALKLSVNNSIVFGDNCRLAWDVLVMDSSFHQLKDKSGSFRNKGYGEIIIGNNNWITSKNVVLHGTKTPDYCVLGLGTIINKDYTKYPTHILLAGNPLTIKAEGVWRDVDDDEIDYNY